MDIHTTMSQVSHHNMLHTERDVHRYLEFPLVNVKAPFFASPLSQKGISSVAAMLTRAHILYSPGLDFVRGARDPGERKKKSPTKSTDRARWNSLQPWTTFTREVLEYIGSLPYEEHNEELVGESYLKDKNREVRKLRDPVHEDDFHDIFKILYGGPHSFCATGDNVTHQHATIERNDRRRIKVLPDFALQHGSEIVGIIECKCFWNVTAQEIDEVIKCMT
jgi:hypothetical protein